MFSEISEGAVKVTEVDCNLESVRSLKEKMQEIPAERVQDQKYLVELRGVILVSFGTTDPSKMLQHFCANPQCRKDKCAGCPSFGKVPSIFAHDCEFADWSGSFQGVLCSGDNLLTMCNAKSADNMFRAASSGDWGSLTFQARCNVRVSVSSENRNLWDNDFGI